jgi:hypothetical protein
VAGAIAFSMDDATPLMTSLTAQEHVAAGSGVEACAKVEKAVDRCRAAFSEDLYGFSDRDPARNRNRVAGV